MGILAPGSAHPRPAAQHPITSGNFSLRPSLGQGCSSSNPLFIGMPDSLQTLIDMSHIISPKYIRNLTYLIYNDAAANWFGLFVVASFFCPFLQRPFLLLGDRVNTWAFISSIFIHPLDQSEQSYIEVEARSKTLVSLEV
jgi:hypothetical protein